MIVIPTLYINIKDIKGSVEGYKDTINRRIVECIDMGFNNDLDVVTLFFLQIEDEEDGNGFFLKIRKDEWEKSLIKSIKYFEDIEDYELCSYVKDVLERITE